jgi:hypothetical protein
VITKIKAKLPKKLHRNFARMVTDLLLFFAKDMQKNFSKSGFASLHLEVFCAAPNHRKASLFFPVLLCIFFLYKNYRCRQIKTRQT